MTLLFPPRIEFDNNKSCNNFVGFIVNTLLERVCSGAISVLGRVGEVDPPHLVMPLTVEPTKPRLCHDNRFLNLWMVDRPFRLDNLSQLPRYLTKGCYQTTLDDKSGYDHILLDVSSRTFFGIRWRGWYFVSNTIPFGWKISAYVYHSTGLLVSHFLRSIGVPCSLYIDDRHNGELQSKTSYPSASTLATPSDETRLEASKAAVFLAAYTLTSLGYTLGLKKCVFTPQKRIKYLGFISDSDLEAFYLPPDKQTSFLALVNSILCGSCVSTVTLQRLAGKCISFRLAVQDSRLYTNEMNLAISKGSKSSKPIRISPPLRAEVQHWADPSVVARIGKWRDERHLQFVVYSDASSFAWGGRFPRKSHVSVSDYWTPSTAVLDITTKETKALTNTLLSFRDDLRDARVDAYVDNLSLVQAWQSQAARSSLFSDALKRLAEVVLDLNVHLSVIHIPSSVNPADQPSRRFSPADSKLAFHLWQRLQSHPSFGGLHGHSVDLMALDSNSQSDLNGVSLPHFTPYPTPCSSGVDFFAQNFDHPDRSSILSNPYIFPPILLIGQVFNHLRANHLRCTIVVPDVHPRRYWWPILFHSAFASLKLSCKGEQGALLTPSPHGFSDSFKLPWDLWAFRI